VTSAQEFIGQFEGCHRIKSDGLVWPYICPAGHWTQGWGRLVGKDSLPITKAQADWWFRKDLMKYEQYVYNLSPIVFDEPERRQIALTSFVYNLGPGNYRASTLKKRVDVGDWVRAKYEIQKWVFGGGKKLPGLVIRRAAEAALL
jgi:lysozyme